MFVFRKIFTLGLHNFKKCLTSHFKARYLHKFKYKMAINFGQNLDRKITHETRPEVSEADP